MAFIRKSRLFDPKSELPFALSRSKIDLFIDCPRCFYFDRRLGIPRPSGPAFTLNVAVDALLKKEFDVHRAKNTTHPLMAAYGVDAVPFAHAQMNVWRENFTGVRFLHEPTNFLVFGAVDDIWQNKKGELHVVDYKATSKEGEVELGDTKWHNQYRRQMEVYQWLLRHNGFTVSPVGYFVYANGKKDRAAFDGKLDFDVKVIPYEGDDSWVEASLRNAKRCLLFEELPPSGDECEHCEYRRKAAVVEKPSRKKNQKSLFDE
jgi:RecB family exonuclease